MSGALTGAKVDSELARLNQSIWDEYVRITSSGTRAEFSEFVQGIEAQIAARLDVPALFLRAHDAPITQAYRLLEHLRAQPPIAWPSLDLRV